MSSRLLFVTLVGAMGCVGVSERGLDTPPVDSQALVPTGTETGACGDGEVLDCDGDCVDEGYLGDGVCDDGTSAVRVGVNLDCEALDYDLGDCEIPPSLCGDGLIGPGEACDDGNTLPDDGCSEVCQEERCGDGIIQAIEGCDDGDATDEGPCPADCLVCEEDEFEPNNEVIAAAPWDESAPLRACSGNDDWYEVDGSPGDLLQADLTYDASEGLIFLNLVDADGDTLLSDSEKPFGRQVLGVLPEGEAYWRVRLINESTSRQGIDYTLSAASVVCPVDAAEPDDTIADAFQVSPPFAGTGRWVCPGEQDVVKVEVSPGSQLISTVSFDVTEGDLSQVLTDGNGNVLATSTPTTQGLRVEWTASFAGEVFLSTYPITDPGTVDGVGYEQSVTVESCTADSHEPDQDLASLPPLPPVWTNTSLHACDLDVDLFPFELSSGGSVDLTLTWGASEGGLRLRILDPSGQEVFDESQSSGPIFADITGSEDGLYAAEVTLLSDAGTTLGVPYSLSLISESCVIDPLEDDDDQASGTPVSSFPYAQAGLGACSGDDDWFSIPLNAGDRLSVEATFTDAEGDIDLRLYSPSGVSIASAAGFTDDEELTVTVNESGDFGLRVELDSDSGSVLGNVYDLSLDVESCVDDAFEPDDTLSDATPITLPYSGAGGIGCLGDPDHYVLSAQSGDQLDVTVAYDDAEGAMEIFLLDASGTVVDSDTFESNGELTFAYDVPADGDYTLQVVADADGGADVGLPYTVDIASESCAPDALEDNDSSASGTPYTPGTTESGLSACPSDDDWYILDLDAGDRILVDALFDDSEGDIDVRLYNLGSTSSFPVVSSSSSSDNESLRWTPSSDTQVGVEVVLDFDDGAGLGNLYDLTIDVSECTDDAHEPDNVATGVGAPSITLSGLNACRGDIDIFELEADQGSTIDVSVTFDDDEGDPTLRLYDPNGQFMDSDLGGAGVLSLSDYAEMDGVYTLEIELPTDIGELGGSPYDITALALPCATDAYEDNDSESSPAFIGSAASLTGLHSCGGDEDWYAVPAAAGDRIFIEALFDDAEGNIDLYLYSPSGAYVTASTSGSDNEDILHTASSTGDYLVRVKMGTDAGLVVGNPYDLTVSVDGCDPDIREDDDTSGTAGSPLALPTGFTGLTSCPSDPDFFAVDLSVGERLVVSASFIDDEGNVDLRLYSPTGSQVASASSTTDDEVMLEDVTVPGIYTVRANLTSEGGILAGNDYDITFETLTCTGDGNEPNDDSTGATPLPTSLVSLTACVDDEDWFEFTLAPGESISAQALFSDADGNINMRLYEQSNTSLSVASSTSSTDNEAIVFTSTSGGTYFLRVYLYDDDGVEPGLDYQLNASLF